MVCTAGAQLSPAPVRLEQRDQTDIDWSLELQCLEDEHTALRGMLGGSASDSAAAGGDAATVSATDSDPAAQSQPHLPM